MEIFGEATNAIEAWRKRRKRRRMAEAEMEAAAKEKVDTEADESPLIPGLTEDMAMECLVRMRTDPRTLRAARGTCRRWRDMLTHRESFFYKERLRQGIQRPSLFMIPCLHPRSLEYSQFACVPYKSYVLVLGGQRNGVGVSDFRIVDPIARSVKNGPDMLYERLDFVAAVVDNRLYAVGGSYFDALRPGEYAMANVECYDFASEKWFLVQPLPIPACTTRCYVDSSSSPPKLFVAGYHLDQNGSTISVMFSYCPALNSWTQMKESQRVAPEKSFTNSWKWVWCSGEISFQDEAVWQFPKELKVPAHFVGALAQPIMYNDPNVYISPLQLSNCSLGALVFSKVDLQSKTYIIEGNVCPNNAQFLPVSVLTELEDFLVCDIVATTAMRDRMQFPTGGHVVYCMLAIILY